MAWFYRQYLEQIKLGLCIISFNKCVLEKKKTLPVCILRQNSGTEYAQICQVAYLQLKHAFYSGTNLNLVKLRGIPCRNLIWH